MRASRNALEYLRSLERFKNGTFVQGIGYADMLDEAESRALVIPHQGRARYMIPNQVGAFKKRYSGPTFTDYCFTGPEYYFDDGLRFVKPYYTLMSFVFSSKRLKRIKTEGFCSNLEGVLSCLFPTTSKDYFLYKCQNELMWINCEPATLKDPVNLNDFITHLEHAHERPILDLPVEILYEDEDLLVVNKPPSFCISPTSTYKFNTLLFILAKEYGYKDLRPVHRLDKATSGVLMFAKNSKKVTELQSNFFGEGRVIEKEYVALVDGVFPGSMVCHDPISSYNVNRHNYRKLTSKKSTTEFELIKSFENTSLVRAKPITGRTHQIRIHLKNLGYPIVNDSTYNARDSDDFLDCVQPEYKSVLESLMAGTLPPSESSRTYNYQSPSCVKCVLGSSFEKRINPKSKMFICLHSHKYKIGQNYSFEAPLPQWATDAEFVNNRCTESKSIDAS